MFNKAYRSTEGYSINAIRAFQWKAGLILPSDYVYLLLNFNEFNLFNPDLFAGGIFNRSLGDVFINSCLIFWILIFFLINVQFKVYRPRKRSSCFWFASIYLIILYVVGSQFITLCKSLIYNENIYIE